MSNYITKHLASQCAKSLVEKLVLQISEKKKQISDITREIYLKEIPKEIVDLYNKHQNYFNKANSIRCEGNGLNKGFDLKTSVPSTGAWSVCILPSATEAKRISKLSNELDKMVEKKDSLKMSIENTLLSLKTYNRIKKEFPEAYELLPDKEATVNALAVPLEDIRNQLEALKS